MQNGKRNEFAILYITHFIHGGGACVSLPYRSGHPAARANSWWRNRYDLGPSAVEFRTPSGRTYTRFDYQAVICVYVCHVEGVVCRNIAHKHTPIIQETPSLPYIYIFTRIYTIRNMCRYCSAFHLRRQIYQRYF